MATLKEYDVEINGITHTLQLSEEDAKQYQTAKPHKEPKAASAASNKQAAAPANTAASTDNK